MNYSDQLRFIASALLPTHPACAAQLEQIAVGVRRLEHTLDEIIADALEEENIVRLDREPIRGDAA